MQATEFDEEALFSAIARSGVRALLKDVDDIAMLEKLKRSGGTPS